jgi:putative restriction endonuclease
VSEGSPFLFKLHAPHNFIAGGGFYVASSQLSISSAWRIFQEKNGCPDFSSLQAKILSKKRGSKAPLSDPLIGCIILGIPFFLPRELWIPQPSDWHPNIVQGKTYDLNQGEGKRVWDAVMERLPLLPGYLEVGNEVRRKGPLYVVEGRLGQGAFRTTVLDAYHRRCAMTGERTEPALEASHIKPYREMGPNRVNNGLLLRADLHQIFDAGYITITPQYVIEVSRRIKEEFANGRDYYALHGRKIINLPAEVPQQPSRDFVLWHNEHVFRV